MDQPSEAAGLPSPSEDPAGSNEELIKVVDRQGNVKLIPRPEYEQKKRRGKRRESQKGLPIREMVSLALIMALILAASFIALKIMK